MPVFSGELVDALTLGPVDANARHAALRALQGSSRSAWCRSCCG
jgi:hypothetical protein